MKHVLILFGGVSSEHEVSLRSAAAVIRNVDRTRWDVSALGITKDGRWLLYTGDTEKIEDGSWLSDTACQAPAVLSPDRSVHGSTILRIDVVFPVLHGKNGEDGTMQGFLQLAGIPFVGCDALSSAMGMDKAVSNTIADHIGVPQAKWLAVRRAEQHIADPDPEIFLDLEYDPDMVVIHFFENRFDHCVIESFGAVKLAQGIDA